MITEEKRIAICDFYGKTSYYLGTISLALSDFGILALVFSTDSMHLVIYGSKDISTLGFFNSLGLFFKSEKYHLYDTDSIKTHIRNIQKLMLPNSLDFIIGG